MRAIDIIKHPALWGVLLARVVSDPLWLILSYWQAGYLQERMGLTLKQIGYVMWIAPLTASLVMVAVGIFSDRLVKRGWSPVRSRMRIMQCVAVLGPFIFLVPHIDSLPVVIGLLALACMHPRAAIILQLFYGKRVKAEALAMKTA